MAASDSFKAVSAPTERERVLARESSTLLHRKGHLRKGPLTIVVNDQQIMLPGSLTAVLGDCLNLMADGHSVAVVPVEQEIGTQEAADLLGVSRPYLVKLLDTGVIPSRKVGVQRRLTVADVMDFKQREKEARRKALVELAAEGQRLNLGE